MDLGLIVAIAENNVMGHKGRLPWDVIPGDLPRFQKLTMGKPVIMGRKTYDSLPKKFRPLRGRPNIVLTSRSGLPREVEVAHDIAEAISKAQDHQTEQAYLIGGARVYADGLDFADFMEITRVRGEFEGDVYFPEVEWKDWRETGRQDFDTHSFISYQRRE